MGVKRFVHFLINPNKSGIGLFFDEKERLQELGKKLNVKVAVKPLRGVLTREGKVLVFKWFLDHDDCPFLKNNTCLVYDNRPLICRSFPLLPPFSCQPVPNKPVISNYCPSSCSDKEMLESYNIFIKKQDELMQKINEMIRKSLVVSEKSSRVIRMLKDESSITELS